MGTQHYQIENRKRGSSVCASVGVVDATHEPLTILKVLVEGLAENSQAGLWLTNMTTGIPMVPRISPFDLLYLDQNKRVLQCVELLPAADFPPFRRPAVSALVLPLKSIASSKTGLGDKLVFREIEPPCADDADSLPKEAEASGPLSIEGEEVPFELDACAVEPARTLESEPEAILVAPREAENAGADEVRRFDEGTRSHDSRSIAVLSGERAPAPSPSNADEHFPRTTNAHTQDTRIILPSKNSSGRNDFAAKSSEAKEKDWAVSRFLRWLYPGAYDKDRRNARRIPIPSLVAYDTTTGVAQAFEVGDISATGMFLITDERWPVGSILSLSLQREGPQEIGTERRIQLRAGAVRAGKNGVGFSFDLPNGMDLRLWEEPAKDERRQSEPEYVIREFRMARAMALVNRISPPAVEDSRHLLYKELSNVRAESAVNVLLKAEAHLAREQGGDALLVHPDIVVGVVDGGSWADSEWMQELWAGLLAASGTVDGCDDTNIVFVNLLSQLSSIQARVLAAVCEKAVTVNSGNWVVSSEKIFSTAEEMARMAGSHDMLKVHRSLAQLAEFGLLEKSVRASFVSEREGATTTPTALGLRMYSHCLGRRGKL